jgi:uncharacterized hydrophobic protein (TIGR00271 family)
MLFKRFLVNLRQLLDLREDTELEQKTIASITRNISFRGTRLWVLACAILIASIGLNVNSTAVIIGAMLISPLMGPIIGTGLALGTNDFNLLKKSLMHLLNATLISFIVSSLYFWLTPLGDAQSEILSRTTPTIYDVLIAFFGGLAGIIGSSRKEKGVIIPGVAIATALMPPLCTAGYGFATGQMNYLFGAFYLYLINCTFISLATFLMVKYLRYSCVVIIDKAKANRMKWYISLVIFCMIVPSTFFAYQAINRSRYAGNIKRYIADNFTSKGYTIIYKNSNQLQNPGTLELAFLDQVFKPTEIDSLQQLMTQYDLGVTRLVIKQKREQFSNDEWSRVVRNLDNNEEKIKEIENKLFYTQVSEISSAQLGAELKTINSKIAKIDFGNLFIENGKSVQDSVALVIVYKSPLSPYFSNNETQSIRQWLKVRLRKDTVVTFFERIQ